MVSGLHHVSIRVQDPERARTFYEQTLGFSFIELPVDRPSSPSGGGTQPKGCSSPPSSGNTFLILASAARGNA